MTPDDDLAALERHARGATQGQWSADLDMFSTEEGIVASICDEKVKMLVKIETGERVLGADPWKDADSVRRDAAWARARASQEMRDAEYIAAASPGVVLALINELRAARRKLGRR